jgi:hypothetical protein
MKTLIRSLIAIVLLTAASSVGISAAVQSGERLTLEQARQYMVELINRDRASKDLNPVKLDPVATAAGQKHAEEMAAENYLSHWNLDGKMSVQRYTEAGGTDSVHENVFLQTRGRKAAGSGPLLLLQEPTFTRAELEGIEAAYFNEIPPNDGHRRNILNPQRTHVGVGLARGRGDGILSLANTQEFVNRYVEVDAIPQSLSTRAALTVSGRTPSGAKFVCVSVARSPLPARMSTDELQATRGYSVPASFVSYWPTPYDSPQPVEVSSDGRFKVVVRPSDIGRPGLYFVAVWRLGTAGPERGLRCVAENGPDPVTSVGADSQRLLSRFGVLGTS